LQITFIKKTNTNKKLIVIIKKKMYY